MRKLILFIALTLQAATQTTIWRPDTCQCILIYQWDDTASPRVHTPVEQFTTLGGTLIKAFRCSAHTALVVTTIHHTTVGAENTLKNNVFTEIEKTFPALLDPATGNLRSGFATYMWTVLRKLEITLTGLTVAQKTAAQSAVDAKVGSGKVTIK